MNDRSFLFDKRMPESIQRRPGFPYGKLLAGVVVLVLVAAGLFLAGVFDDAPPQEDDVLIAGGGGGSPPAGGGANGGGEPVTPINDTSPFRPGLDDTGTSARVEGEDSGIHLAGRVEGPSGRPLSHATVSLIEDLSSLQNQAQEGEVLAELVTAADGGFIFEGLVIGKRYVVSASHDSYVPARKHPIDPQNPATLSQILRLDRGLSLAGRVVDLGEAPLEGAEVMVFDMSVQTMIPMVRPERVVQSAADGSFVLANVARGMKKVVARKEGFATDGIYPVNLMAQREAEGLTLILVSGESISGTVVDAQTMEPVAGAIVTARPVSEHRSGARRGAVNRGGEGARDGDRWRREGRDGAPPGNEGSGSAPQGQRPHPRFNKRGFLVQTARSDENGNYVLAGLTPGRYHMTSLRKGYQPLVGVSAAAGSSDLVLRLQPSARLLGRVVDAATGEPVRRFTLAANSRPDPIFFPTRGRQRFDDENGAFEYLDVRPGGVALLARAEGYAGGSSELFSVTNGQQVRDVLIRMTKGATIGGLVTDQQGSPVAKAKVALEPEDAGDAAANPLIRILSRQLLGSARVTKTDSEGRWTMPNVFEGDYRIKAEHDAFSPEKSAIFRSPPEGEFEVETLVMRAGGTIRGLVRTASGEPDAKAMVMVRSVGASQTMARSAQTDSQGRFEVGGLEPGSYYIVVTQREGVPNPFEILVAAQKGKTVAVSEGRATTVEL